MGVTPGELSGELPAPRFVAVDNSPGSSHGDVYVGEGVGSPAQNELQYIEFNSATGGTFTLTYEGHTTSAIPFTHVDDGEDAANTVSALEQPLAIMACFKSA